MFLHDFPRRFMCVFQDFQEPFMSIIHVFSKLFSLVDIEHARFAWK